MRSYLALFRNNMRLTLRDRGVLFFNFLFPFVFFFAFAELFHAGTGEGVAYVVAMVLVIGIMGNGLWGAGMRSVTEREANILRRFKVTPISPLPILTASMASGWLLYIPVLVILLATAHFLYQMPMPRHVVSLFVLCSAGVCAFRAIGLILASVVNTQQEATILIQLLYMPMLFLSGVTIPAANLPIWAQTVGQFLPASGLVQGFQGIFFQNQTLLSKDLLVTTGAMALTIAVGLFLARQLFRWEKEEKLPPRNKLWVLVVLAPFVAIGCYDAYSKESRGTNQALLRSLARSGLTLVRNTRVFTGDGKVIENGSVLVRDGKIDGVYEQGAAPDPEKIRADVVEGAGKTLLPGLIDAHVHLTSSGGMFGSGGDFDAEQAMMHSAEALLYSGVTAARSTGDGLDASIKTRSEIAGGAKLGSQLFICGPMFTTESGHGTEFLQYVPKSLRSTLAAQIVRTPKTPAEARKMVDELKRAGVDGIKAILEAGWGDGMLFDRMDLLLARTVAEEARAKNLPVAVHTGDARDVTDAVDIGASSIEHGSMRDAIPDAVLARMAERGVYLDPTLGVAEAYANYYGGKADALNNSLVQQTVPAKVIKETREYLASTKALDKAKSEMFAHGFEQARANLVRAWKAGVPLALGTDAGNPTVFPGPSIHHELQLWVQAGIPAEVALAAATYNAAKLLRASNHIGGIRPGMDANLLLIDGNPLQDIAATERISMVMFEGERINRSGLFDQK
jgi:imidazolonepropionase-like amidohydrolase/ABC-type multidrug transport system permease subunit